MRRKMERIEAICAFTESLVTVRILPDQEDEQPANNLEAVADYGNVTMRGYLEPLGPDATYEEGPYEFICDKFVEDMNKKYGPTEEDVELWDMLKEKGIAV